MVGTNPADHCLRVVTPLVKTNAEGKLETTNQLDIAKLVDGFNALRCNQVLEHVDLRLSRSFEDHGKKCSRTGSQEFDDSFARTEVCAARKSGRARDERLENFHIELEPRISQLREFAILMKKHCLLIVRNPQASLVRLVSTVFLCLLGGLVYLQLPLDQSGLSNRQGALFSFVTNTFTSALLGSLNVFPGDRRVFLKEFVSNQYHRFPYWLAKSTLSVPFTLILGTLYSVVVYFLSGMQAQNFGLFLLTILLNYEAATSIGFFLSAGVKHQQTALSLAPILLIPMLLFGGFFVAPGTIPVYMDWVGQDSEKFFVFLTIVFL